MTAAPVFNVGGVKSLGEVAVEVGGIPLHEATIQFAADHDHGERAGIGPVVGDVPSGRRPDQHQAGPEVGVGQADVPGGVTPERVAGEKHPVAVDREPPHRLAEPTEHRRVLPRRRLVGGLMRRRPGGRDDDRAVAGSLTEAAAVRCGHASPPLDLIEGSRPGRVERHDRGIPPERIVFRRQLHETAHAFLAIEAGHREFVEAR